MIFLDYCKCLFHVPLTWTKVSLLFLIFIIFRKHDVIWNKTFEISFPNFSFLALSNNSSPHNNFKCKTNSWTNPKESKWHTIYLEKIKRVISTIPWQVKDCITIVIILWKRYFTYLVIQCKKFQCTISINKCIIVTKRTVSS